MSLDSFLVVRGGLDRVKHLIATYEYVAKARPQSRQTPPTDILRAAVVLLHAVLEEYVRHVVAQELPASDGALLDEVPVVGTRRGTKVTLGQLAEHRGKTVELLIQESVQAHLERKSFSSIGDVLGVLRDAGVNTRVLARVKDQLGPLIARRHEIVHRGDQIRRSKSNPWIPRSISKRQVVSWARAVEVFVERVEGARQR